MKQSRGRNLRPGCYIFSLLVIMVLAQALPAQTADQRATIKQARQSYYSLKSEGMNRFQCEMVPNWAALLQNQRAADPERIDAAIERLKGLHFSVTVAADGAAKVAHNEIKADNQQMAEGLAQVYSGMEQMTTGFFQTWSVFVVTPPLPEVNTEFKLESGAQYGLSYKDGGTDVATVMGRDFTVSSLKVTAKDFVSTLNPRFVKTPKGWLMSGYDAEYIGASEKDKTELHVGIAYQMVAGLQLPQKLDLKGTYGGNPFQVEVTFSGCTVGQP